ncbi:MAG TPA: hypothetical protein EYP98_06290 [Planctomycetes bacterium]|nr:hypothetical protein [Planctomycetota bacterium]
MVFAISMLFAYLAFRDRFFDRLGSARLFLAGHALGGVLLTFGAAHLFEPAGCVFPGHLAVADHLLDFLFGTGVIVL